MARRSSSLPAASVLFLVCLTLCSVTFSGASAAKLTYTVELSRGEVSRGDGAGAHAGRG